jgi:hypothetical protein
MSTTMPKHFDALGVSGSLLDGRGPPSRLHAEFERLVSSMGKGKAIVAIARKLLVVVWHVLTKQVGDCHADVAMVTRKLQRWDSSTA